MWLQWPGGSVVLDAHLRKEIAQRIRTAAPDVEDVLLFGSHARGDAQPDSDVDLVLLVAEGADRKSVLLRARRSLLGLGIGFDLVLLTRAQWALTPTSGWLGAQMAREAVRVDVAA